MTSCRASINAVTSLLLLFSLFGCAYEVPRSPTQFGAINAAVEPTPVEVAESVAFNLDTGYPRTVSKGSKWVITGRVSQGLVYKPLRQVFTVEGSHQHEAYLVLENGVLVGFYVPFDQSFVAQSVKVTIKFTS